MKKFTVLIIALLTFNLSHAQKKIENLEEVTASNGVTYRIRLHPFQKAVTKL